MFYEWVYTEALRFPAGFFCVWFLVNVVSLTFFCLGLDVVHQIIFYVFIFEKRPDNSTGRVLES